jgi:hypothetical protein
MLNGMKIAFITIFPILVGCAEIFAHHNLEAGFLPCFADNAVVMGFIFHYASAREIMPFGSFGCGKFAVSYDDKVSAFSVGVSYFRQFLPEGFDDWIGHGMVSFQE